MEFRSYADVQKVLDAEAAAGHQNTPHSAAMRNWWYNYKPPTEPSTPPPPPPPPARPPDPWIRASSFVEGVRQADPDIIITAGEEAISPELLLELQYEDLAGVELINISRSDSIDGQNVIYSPVKNLSSVRRKYNPNNIIAMPAVSSSLFSKYAIDLILRIGEDPSTGLPYEPYFDQNGNLVIEIEDVREDEIVEVEVDTSGTINLVDFT